MGIKWFGDTVVNTVKSAAWKLYYTVVNASKAACYTGQMVADLLMVVHAASSEDWQGTGEGVIQVGKRVAEGVGGMTTTAWKQLQYYGEAVRDINGMNALHHTLLPPYKGTRQ